MYISHVYHIIVKWCVGETKTFTNPKTGSKFTGTALREEEWSSHNAVVVKVEGKGHYMGESKFWLEEDDRIGTGFLF